MNPSAQRTRASCPQAMEGHASGCWAEMAPDLLAHIFVRLPMTQLLRDIPLVCKPWKLASLNPLCWRSLHFSQPVTPSLLRRLLQRSNGVLQEFTLSCEQDHQCLQLVAHSAPLLQKLHISESCADDEWAAYAAPLMPCITDLDLSMCEEKFSHLALEAFGKNCRGITKLRRNRTSLRFSFSLADDHEAFAIAEHYPFLEYLELQANPLSAHGLRAILDGCPRLKHFDVAGCIYITLMDGTLWNLCRTRLKVFVEPSCATFDDDCDTEDDSEDVDCWVDDYSLDGDDFENGYSDEYQIDEEFPQLNEDWQEEEEEALEASESEQSLDSSEDEHEESSEASKDK